MHCGPPNQNFGWPTPPSHGAAPPPHGYDKFELGGICFGPPCNRLQ